MTTSEFAAARPVQAHVRLAPRASAPRIARKLLRDACAEAGLPRDLIDDAALIIGELVTTSVRQARKAVDVLVSVAGEDVTMRIRDDGTTSLWAARTSRRRRARGTWCAGSAPRGATPAEAANANCGHRWGSENPDSSRAPVLISDRCRIGAIISG